MTRRSQLDNLDGEDRVLWSLVARSTRPLRAADTIPPEPKDLPKDKAAKEGRAAGSAPAPSPEPKAPKSLYVAQRLDQPTLDKLSKGRLPIEGRVDLHGMTQDEAYSLLLSFLGRAHVQGIRYVLVITGKGSSSKGDGVLRRAVPAWLTTPPFRMLVSSHDAAARHHGGGGAIYVRLRKAMRP